MTEEFGLCLRGYRPGELVLGDPADDAEVVLTIRFRAPGGRANRTGRVWAEAETTSRLGGRLSTAPSLPVSLRPTAYK